MLCTFFRQNLTTAPLESASKAGLNSAVVLFSSDFNTEFYCIKNRFLNPAGILHKSIAGRDRPVSAADGPITARCRFIKNASWEESQFKSIIQEFHTSMIA